MAGEWTSVSTSPAKFGGGGIVHFLNFGDEDEDEDDDDEKRLLGLRQAGSRRQKVLAKLGRKVWFGLMGLALAARHPLFFHICESV